MNNIRKYSIPK